NTHRPRVWLRGISHAVTCVAAAEAPGHQSLNWCSQQFVARVAEERLGLPIDNAHDAPVVDNYYRVRGGIEQRRGRKFEDLFNTWVRRHESHPMNGSGTILTGRIDHAMTHCV